MRAAEKGAYDNNCKLVSKRLDIARGQGFIQFKNGAYVFCLSAIVIAHTNRTSHCNYISQDSSEFVYTALNNNAQKKDSCIMVGAKKIPKS